MNQFLGLKKALLWTTLGEWLDGWDLNLRPILKTWSRNMMEETEKFNKYTLRVSPDHRKLWVVLTSAVAVATSVSVKVMVCAVAMAGASVGGKDTAISSCSVIVSTVAVIICARYHHIININFGTNICSKLWCLIPSDGYCYACRHCY